MVNLEKYNWYLTDIRMTSTGPRIWGVEVTGARDFDGGLKFEMPIGHPGGDVK